MSKNTDAQDLREWILNGDAETLPNIPKEVCEEPRFRAACQAVAIALESRIVALEVGEHEARTVAPKVLGHLEQAFDLLPKKVALVRRQVGERVVRRHAHHGAFDFARGVVRFEPGFANEIIVVPLYIMVGELSADDHAKVDQAIELMTEYVSQSMSPTMRLPRVQPATSPEVIALARVEQMERHALAVARVKAFWANEETRLREVLEETTGLVDRFVIETMIRDVPRRREVALKEPVTMPPLDLSRARATVSPYSISIDTLDEAEFIDLAREYARHPDARERVINSVRAVLAAYAGQVSKAAADLGCDTETFRAWLKNEPVRWLAYAAQLRMAAQDERAKESPDREWKRRIKREKRRTLHDPYPVARLAGAMTHMLAESTRDTDHVFGDVLAHLAHVARSVDHHDRWIVALRLVLEANDRLEPRKRLPPWLLVCFAKSLSGDAPWPTEASVVRLLESHVDATPAVAMAAVERALQAQVDEKQWLEFLALQIRWSRDGRTFCRDPLADPGTNVAELARSTGRRDDAIKALVAKLVQAGTVERVRSSKCSLRFVSHTDRHGMARSA